MPAQDTSELKGKIIAIFRDRGPSLPVHVARETDLSILFASAFLSELISEKKVKTSNMRIGSSPLYFLPGHEHLLEDFADNLKSKEREAFLLLKENRFLKDSEQEPAIRVALRAIKDFAISFNRGDEIYWRYFTVPESEFESGKKEEVKIEPAEKKEQELRKEEISEDKSDEENEKEEQKQGESVDIFDKNQKNPDGINFEEKKHVKKAAKKAARKKAATSKSAKQTEKFLERVKEFISKTSAEIVNIEDMKTGELSLRIRVNGDEQLLVAYNKKRIAEKEIVKAAKKADYLGLKYSVLSLGELPKKVSELIDALQNIKDIGKIE